MSEISDHKDGPPIVDDPAPKGSEQDSGQLSTDGEKVRLTVEGKPFRAQRKGKIDRLPPAVRRELDQKLASGNFVSYRALSQWLEERACAFISGASLNYYKKFNFDYSLVPVTVATAAAEDIVKATGGDNEKMNRALTMMVQTRLFDMLVQMNRAMMALNQAGLSRRHSANILEKREERATTAKAANSNASEGAVSFEGRTRPDDVTEAVIVTDDEDEAGSDGQDRPLEPKYPTRAEIAAISILTKSTTLIGGMLLDRAKWEAEERRKLDQSVAVANQTLTKVFNEGGLSADAETKIRAALMEITI